MTDRVVEIDRYIEAASELVDLRIEASWRPGVATYLGLAADMAAILDTVELDDAELILAPVYTPPDRADVAGADD